MSFLLGRPIFRGYVSFREGNHQNEAWLSDASKWPLDPHWSCENVTYPSKKMSKTARFWPWLFLSGSDHFWAPKSLSKVACSEPPKNRGSFALSSHVTRFRVLFSLAVVGPVGPVGFNVLVLTWKVKTLESWKKYHPPIHDKLSPNRGVAIGFCGLNPTRSYDCSL